MDYLFSKSDGTATSLGGTVNKVKLPEQTKGDTATKKSGPTTTVIDTDAVTVTLTHTAVALSTAEKAQLEINRLEALETPTKLAEAVLTDDGKTWLQANRDLIQTELDKL